MHKLAVELALKWPKILHDRLLPEWENGKTEIHLVDLLHFIRIVDLEGVSALHRLAKILNWRVFRAWDQDFSSFFRLFGYFFCLFYSSLSKWLGLFWLAHGRSLLVELRRAIWARSRDIPEQWPPKPQLGKGRFFFLARLIAFILLTFFLHWHV